MRFRPISPAALVGELTSRIAERRKGDRLRVVIDGAPVAGTGALADVLVAPLRAAGRPVLRVAIQDFLRPASVRLERGRTDPEAFYRDWLDTGALRREVLDPLAPGGSGQVLPALWDAATDRAYRLAKVELATGGILLADGALSLGRDLPWDLTVHLALSEAALARLLPGESHWQLPAYRRYLTEVDPLGQADVVVRMDHPAHPAVMHPA
ncbi:MAG: uridine kinase [Sciscionella sp.]